MTITELAPPPTSGRAPTPRLNAALAAFQAELPKIAKDQTGDIKGKEGKQGFKYGYAGLDTVSDAVMPLLGKNGLAFTAWPTLVDGKFVMEYTLLHESGEQRDGIWPLPTAATPMELGGKITYYRRYALMAVTGVFPGGEDDGGTNSDAVQQYDRPRSAAEAFESATPAPPRNGQRQQPPAPSQPRPPVTVPPLEDGDAWKDRIEDIADEAEGRLLREEIAGLLADGTIAEGRAHRLNAVLTARGLSLMAQNGSPRPGRQPAQVPPIRAEDQGARKPAAPEAAEDDAGWVAEFYTALSEASGDAITNLQRSIGRAVADKKIQADTAGELAAAIRKRRADLAAVPA